MELQCRIVLRRSWEGGVGLFAMYRTHYKKRLDLPFFDGSPNLNMSEICNFPAEYFADFAAK